MYILIRQNQKDKQIICIRDNSTFEPPQYLHFKNNFIFQNEITHTYTTYHAGHGHVFDFYSV